MSTPFDPPAKTEVTISLKAGSATKDPWITITAASVTDALTAFGEKMEELMEVVSKVGPSFQRLYDSIESNPPKPKGQTGKPANADVPATTEDELPFAAPKSDPVETGKDAPFVRVCKHGQKMELMEHKGKRYHVCVAKPKGDPDKCPTIPED